MTGFATRVPSPLRNSRVAIAITAGGCLLFLTAVLKNVLNVPAAQLTSDMVLYIIIYTGVLATFPLAEGTETGSPARTALFAGIIVLVTLTIIAVYAI